MTSRNAWLLLCIATLAFPLAGCGSDDPVDAAGTWTLQTTNRDNGCGFAGWTVGDSGSTTVTIVQDGEAVTGQASGYAQAILNLWLGASTFAGTVDGDGVAMALDGDGRTQGSCAYNIRATFSATVDGDTMSDGRLEYRPITNGNVDCNVYNDCLSWQEFSGARPPQ